MFYPCSIDLIDGSAAKHAVIVLTPAESRRLLAKAVVGLPEVRWAFENGKLAIPAGSTGAFVVEELTGEKIEPYRFCVGMSAAGMLTQTLPDDRIYGRFYDKGRESELSYQDFIASLGQGDVVIKGANAVDSAGNVGVLLSSDVGGLVGLMFGIVSARGIKVICPVGLEKQVASVPEASAGWGQLSLDYSMGLRVGMSSLTDPKVLTEIQALATLAGVRARHLGSGGIGGNEGAVILLLEGSSEGLERTLELVQSVKGEPPIEVIRHHLQYLRLATGQLTTKKGR
ncbi:MAG: hypothetical protein M1274_08555 [Actinobacteria bacterium]|nr:hypothetical protein [Actinomycetota bacterium]